VVHCFSLRLPAQDGLLRGGIQSVSQVRLEHRSARFSVITGTLWTQPCQSRGTVRFLPKGDVPCHAPFSAETRSIEGKVRGTHHLHRPRRYEIKAEGKMPRQRRDRASLSCAMRRGLPAGRSSQDDGCRRPKITGELVCEGKGPCKSMGVPRHHPRQKRSLIDAAHLHRVTCKSGEARGAGAEPEREIDAAHAPRDRRRRGGGGDASKRTGESGGSRGVGRGETIRMGAREFSSLPSCNFGIEGTRASCPDRAASAYSRFLSPFIHFLYSAPL